MSILHLQNLSNFGILPLIFTNSNDWNRIAQGDSLTIPDVRNAIGNGNNVKVINMTKNETYETEHSLTPNQVDMVKMGGLINLVKEKRNKAGKNRPA